MLGENSHRTPPRLAEVVVVVEVEVEEADTAVIPAGQEGMHVKPLGPLFNVAPAGQVTCAVLAAATMQRPSEKVVPAGHEIQLPL